MSSVQKERKRSAFQDARQRDTRHCTVVHQLSPFAKLSLLCRMRRKCIIVWCCIADPCRYGLSSTAESKRSSRRSCDLSVLRTMQVVRAAERADAQ